MQNKALNTIATTFLIIAISFAGMQAALANTTGPEDFSKESTPSTQRAGDQPPRQQSITPGPVPADVIVSGGGLEWVWASPCEAGGCGNPDPANQVGWRYATFEELTQQFPSCDAFVAQDGSNICASRYFDPNHQHCDLDNCEQGLICSTPGEPCVNGEVGVGYGETFYVRGESIIVPAVPVPVMSTLGVAVLILGLVLLMRRRVVL